MSKYEVTSPEVAKIAARGLRSPGSLTHDEIKKVCGSALTQAPDQHAPTKNRLAAFFSKIFGWRFAR